tara:strand:- start:1378 stop:1854 length:477 start_codon:yes stop_codon:yes gene_type:complete
MNRTLIKTGLFFLVFSLLSCSYNPIFSEKNYNFEIQKINYSGDKEINKIIQNKLKLIRNSQSTEKKKYNLDIYSKKKRNIISKDSKGDPLKFEMIISVQYKITNDGKLLLNKEIEKNNIYNSDSDLFELEQSEKIIIENISGNISDNVISSIINLDDN